MNEYCRCGNPLSYKDIQSNPNDPYCKYCWKEIQEILDGKDLD